MRGFLLFALVATAAAGCVHEFAYVPVDAAGAGMPAARYPVPPEAPQGEVYVTSFGFTQMDVAEGRTADMMHARLVAVNGGGVPWTVDGRAQQLAVMPGQAPLVPAYINTDTGMNPGPVYVVPPQQRRVLDLFYAVPAPLDHPLQLGGFALDWRVDVAGRPVTGRTPFQRFEGGPPAGYEVYPDYLFVGLGWGPGWWYGSYFPYGYRPIIRSYYYPPARARSYGAWQGAPRTAPPGGQWRGTPGGSPTPRSGGWRGRPR